MMMMITIVLYFIGKVRLVTNDGNCYEISSGVQSSFVQILTAAKINKTNDTVHNPSTTTSTAKNTKKKNSTNNNVVKDKSKDDDNVNDNNSNMYMMGSITKKLVVIPEYDIATKKTKNISSSLALHSSSLALHSAVVSSSSSSSSWQSMPASLPIPPQSLSKSKSRAMSIG